MKELFKYQKEIVDKCNSPSSALFMSMGTGKTVTSLSLFKKSKCPKILIICLISKLNDWKDDLFDECDITAKILNKGSKKNTEMLQDGNAFVVNFESAWRCPDLLKWVDKNTFVLIDESHHIKNPSSRIGKFCDKLRQRTTHKCILTGTPQSKGYIDYFNQLKFVDIYPYSYKSFCDRYCVYQTMQFTGRPFKELCGYQNTQELDELINKNCIFYDRNIDDDMIPTDIDVRIPKPKVYNKYKRSRIYEDYFADNASKLFVSCRTLCSGYIDKYEVDDGKIKWLEDMVDDLSTRLVIFYNFNVERDSIIKLLTKHNIPYSEYNGRDKDLHNFINNKNGVAVCQYISASTGINDLVHANICIMYSPSLSYTDWSQARKRIDRIGQTKKPLYYNLCCQGTVEDKIWRTLKEGKDFDTKMFINYLTNDE